jgi:hypothetical protein
MDIYLSIFDLWKLVLEKRKSCDHKNFYGLVTESKKFIL